MLKNNGLTRRRFIEASVGGLVLATSHRLANGLGKSHADRVAVGVIGVGRRGCRIAHEVGGRGGRGGDLAALCDVWPGRFDSVPRPARRRGSDIMLTGDYRRILDRKDIDAVVIATPDHWHRTMLIDVVSAGKHVYLETPIARTIRRPTRWSASSSVPALPCRSDTSIAALRHGSTLPRWLPMA